jgi:hypothetical protein
LERVKAHIKAARGVSQDDRLSYEEKLICKYVVQEETIIVDISTLIPSMKEGQGDLPPWQIRPVQKWFVFKLRDKMEIVGVNKVVGPFLLMFDPTMCSIREDFDVQKKNQYKYQIIGGNHSAYARMDLTAASPNYSAYKRIQSWIFVGLNNVQARTLAWIRNIDNEFKSNMTLI